MQLTVVAYIYDILAMGNRRGRVDFQNKQNKKP